MPERYSGYSVGGMASAVTALVLLPEHSFRIMYALGLLPLVTIVPLAWRYLPESISFLARGRTAEARALADRYSVDLPPTAAAPSAGNMRTLLTGPRRIPLALLVVASFCGLLLVYGINTWLPNIMRQVGYSLGSSLSFLLVLNLGASRALCSPPASRTDSAANPSRSCRSCSPCWPSSPWAPACRCPPRWPSLPSPGSAPSAPRSWSTAMSPPISSTTSAPPPWDCRSASAGSQPSSVPSSAVGSPHPHWVPNGTSTPSRPLRHWAASSLRSSDAPLCANVRHRLTHRLNHRQPGRIARLSTRPHADHQNGRQHRLAAASL